MKRWLLLIMVLGLAVTAWGGGRSSNATFSAARPGTEPLGMDGVIQDPYVGWVSTYPSYYSTSLGPGGTVGSFAGNDPPDSTHWYRYWLGPDELINWRINSSNPAFTKYNAYLYESVDGQPGELLTEAVGANNPDSIVYQNGPLGTYVFLCFTLARGNNADNYTLSGTRAAPQTSPYFISNFALNGAVQNGNEITDGVEARMITGRYDDWYYWYLPDTINGQPVAAIKLDLAFDSTAINLDLYAQSNQDPLQTPYFDTVLAWTNGPHYSAGTGWVTKETGWIYRSPGDNPGIWLHVHTTNDYGYSQVYRIDNAMAMTSNGVEVAYPGTVIGAAYLDSYSGATFYYSDQESPVIYNNNYNYDNDSQEPPQQAPPPPIRRDIRVPPFKVRIGGSGTPRPLPVPYPSPIKVRASEPVTSMPLPVPEPAPIRPVETPVFQAPPRVQEPLHRIEAPVQIQEPVRPQQPVVNVAPPSPPPPPSRVVPAETPGVTPGGQKNPLSLKGS